MPNRAGRRDRYGAITRARELDLQSRNHERRILHFVKSRTDPPLGGLGRSRFATLQDALRNPNPLPATTEDVAADKERGRVAMLEVNEAIDNLPNKYAQSIATLRAGKPKIGIRQTGSSISSLPTEPSVDETHLTNKHMYRRGDITYSAFLKSDEMQALLAANKLKGPQFGEYETLSKDEYEQLGLRRGIKRLRQEYEEKDWDTGDEEEEEEVRNGFEDWGSEEERGMEQALRD